MDNIGRNIKIARKRMGYSQEELAEKLGYKHKTSVSQVELGKQDLSLSKLSEFAVALQTTPEQLMGWIDTDVKIQEVVLDLNEEGQEKVLEYAEMLRDTGKYNKEDV